MFQKPSVRKSLGAMQALFRNNQNVVVLSTLFLSQIQKQHHIGHWRKLTLSQIKYEFLRSYTIEIWKWGIIQNLVLMCGTKSRLLLWIMDGQVVGSV